MNKYGEVENLNVCDNTSDHMVGNVYCKFREEEEAVAAMAGLAGRFYGGAYSLPESCYSAAGCHESQHH
jgi:splicing factor U2AF subunit